MGSLSSFFHQTNATNGTGGGRGPRHGNSPYHIPRTDDCGWQSPAPCCTIQHDLGHSWDTGLQTRRFSPPNMPMVLSTCKTFCRNASTQIVPQRRSIRYRQHKKPQLGISCTSTGSCPNRCRQDILDPYTCSSPSNRRLGNLMLTVDSMHSYTGPRSEPGTREMLAVTAGVV